MTRNPPELSPETVSRAVTRPKFWLDHDPAADGPNYLGYTMLMLPVYLLAMLAIFAVAVL